jgi:hypothetical protein
MRLLLILLLLLCAFGAAGQQASPTPRNRTKQHQGPDEKTDRAETVPNSSTVIVENQYGSTDKGQGPKKESQGILEKAFAPETWANWALFIAAVVAGYIALETLKQISTQSSAMIVSQRAQLIAVIQSPIKGLEFGQQPIVPIELKNTGLTPAYHCSYETWIEVLDVPFVDFTTAADGFKSPFPTTIYPNTPAPTVVHVALQHALTNREFSDFPPGKKSLCFRVRIEYEDAFKAERWCEFAYEFTGQRVGALPKYNDAN